MSSGRILVVDDEAPALKSLTHILRQEGHEVSGRENSQNALTDIETQEWDVIVTDLRMKGADGMALLQRARECQAACEVIMITGHASLDSAIEAMKQGAFHYIAKPYRIDEVRQVVKNALEVVLLKRENQALKERIAGFPENCSIITRDARMLRLLDMARQIAPTGCSALITGESGTGKELFARYLHQHSGRREGRFVAVNCGALQEDLLTNELFGHERGAFTGADRQKPGLIEMADGGTLFLDEIAEMTPAMQVRLLRVIQEREVLRVGGTTPLKVDVRFLAATNRNLSEAVASGRFRSDLFYRLNVVNLELPPLRERRDDIALLAHFFLRRASLAMGKAIDDITPEAMRLLTRYDHPGNVRELMNLIERGVAIGRGDSLGLADLPESLRAISMRISGPSASLPTLEGNEAAYIAQVLEYTEGNRNRAAEILGIDRVSLWRRLRRYGLTG
ncbi:MAG: response regulator [Rhodocyclaceae bacterium]|nr:response regulator [Rhodocyclaceae bacterium]